jgi:hypothetical protein
MMALPFQTTIQTRTEMDVPSCSYEFWLGSREEKYSGSGVERSVRPADTIRRARAVLDGGSPVALAAGAGDRR